MKKQIPVQTVELEIHDHPVTIEVYWEKKFGYVGCWICPSVPLARGASSKICDTIDLAIMVNEMNASVGLGMRLSHIERSKRNEESEQDVGERRR